MPNQIHLTVATIVEREGQFLMVKETKFGRQVINQPAGHVEPGEDIQAAALRETLEETGWHVELTGFLGFLTSFNETSGITYYRLAFAAKPLEFDKAAVIDPDIDYALWMSYEEIQQNLEQLRSPGVISCLDDYLAKRVFPMEIFRNAL
ncbi:NUDIX hydrolase [Porticoccaceae bacterium]|nr:NUDIX hydrolase [Porticoccaceae bacterium]MBT6592427.1 NUDIX hydrolase [Porticoccaceae bacterium]MDB4428037.1 NUDIX hydrolase [Porticoccaceae bacterium]MDG1080005.1 NUDIX hydrolase [Porticoccaceae bacterium]MDG1081511.1 NUDIX hydrolase [Porticoccaceae bacterium]